MKRLPFVFAVLLVTSIAWSQEPPTCALDRSFFEVCGALWNSCGGVPSVDAECRRFADAFFARPTQGSSWEPAACIPPEVPFRWLRSLTESERVCIRIAGMIPDNPHCVDSQCKRARAIRACETGVGCNDPGPYGPSPKR